MKQRKWSRYEKKMTDKAAEKRGRRNFEGNVKLQNSCNMSLVENSHYGAHISKYGIKYYTITDK